MYLFTRMATLGGRPRSSMAWAAEVTAHVNDHVDRPVTMWASQFGNPLGTVVWSTWVDSHADLQATFAGLETDDGFNSLLEAGQEFMTAPPEDALRQAIHGGPGATATGDPPGIGAVATVTTAVVGNGKYAEVMAWGVDMADHVTSVTELPTMFLADVYGTFGQVTWIAGAADMAGADAANVAINNDPAYIKRLSDAGELFLPGSGRRSMVVRVA